MRSPVSEFAITAAFLFLGTEEDWWKLTLGIQFMIFIVYFVYEFEAKLTKGFF